MGRRQAKRRSLGSRLCFGLRCAHLLRHRLDVERAADAALLPELVHCSLAACTRTGAAAGCGRGIGGSAQARPQPPAGAAPTARSQQARPHHHRAPAPFKTNHLTALACVGSVIINVDQPAGRHSIIQRLQSIPRRHVAAKKGPAKHHAPHAWMAPQRRGSRAGTPASWPAGGGVAAQPAQSSPAAAQQRRSAASPGQGTRALTGLHPVAGRRCVGWVQPAASH